MGASFGKIRYMHVVSCMWSVVVKSLIEVADHCEEKAMKCNQNEIKGRYRG